MAQTLNPAAAPVPAEGETGTRAPAPRTKQRLESLDVFRGATIAAMLLVNNPGTGDAVYPPLRHAEWHGWTFTDLIFPFFLWIVGVAMTFSFAKRLACGDGRGTLLLHALRRSAVIFALGLFLAAVPRFDPGTIRIPGVLQRIAVCYLVATVIYLWSGVRGQILSTAALLGGYWIVMRFVPVPGHGAGALDVDGNFAHYVDSMLLRGHMWASNTWDPEGIVSTLPAIATTLLGILTGHILRARRSAPEKTAWIFLVGNALIVAGLAMDAWLPINKNLWTSSFSVFMAGMAASVFAACYWLVDVQGLRRWAKPFAIYGMNAIALYVMAGLLAKLLAYVRVSAGAGPALTLKAYLFSRLFAPLAAPVNASLLFGLCFVLIFFLIACLMYHFKWFYKGLMSGPAMSSDPLSEYGRRLAARRSAAALKDRMHRTIGNLRLALFVAAAAIAWLWFGPRLLSPWWLAAPAVFFAVLVVVHERVARARGRLERAAGFYEQGIARLQDRWAGRGTAGTRYSDASHPYADDLDLFGKGSLFELLCTARTRAGEDALAGWLRAPASPAEIRSRQEAVEELRHRLDVREDIAVLGSGLRSTLDPAALAGWGSAPPLLSSGKLRGVAAALAVLGAAGLILWGVTGIAAWFAVPAAVEGGFALWLRPRVRRVIEAVEAPGRDLALLAQLLQRLEGERFRCRRLVELRRALETQGQPPSVRIARLNQLIVLLDSRRNQMFALIAGVLLWGTQMAFAIEAWRRKSGPAVRRWLEAAGEMEALCALAGHSYEHPRDPFPEIVDGGPCFEAVGLGHPLLPDGRNVRNDLTLGPDLSVLVISGSNMSGKSTLLRSVGTNAVLALCGSPVRALRLRISPLAVGGCIRITDSLQAGSSRFYTEITRLRQLVDITRGPLSLLFLLDELLQGTNSHDRSIGAEAVIRGLAQRGAIGLLTTHDLALAHIAEVLAPRAANVHFEDRLENGRIEFDYRLRPGVVQRSNALELMRSVGLDV